MDDHLSRAEVGEGDLVEARNDLAVDFVDAEGAEGGHGK
jgi:hypothetical protein